MYLQVLHLSTVSICVQNPYIYCVSLRQNLHLKYLYLQPPSIYNTYSSVSACKQPPYISTLNLPSASIYLQYLFIYLYTCTASTFLHYKFAYSLHLSTKPIHLSLHVRIQPPHISIINLPTASIYPQYLLICIYIQTASTDLRYQSTYSLHYRQYLSVLQNLSTWSLPVYLHHPSTFSINSYILYLLTLSMYQQYIHPSTVSIYLSLCPSSTVFPSYFFPSLTVPTSSKRHQRRLNVFLRECYHMVAIV
jgi:hypothetical protein